MRAIALHAQHFLFVLVGVMLHSSCLLAYQWLEQQTA